jgi:hypothetical protein
MISRVLPFIDRAFLRQKVSAYVAAHSLELNEGLSDVVGTNSI